MAGTYVGDSGEMEFTGRKQKVVRRETPGAPAHGRPARMRADGRVGGIRGMLALREVP